MAIVREHEHWARARGIDCERNVMVAAVTDDDVQIVMSVAVQIDDRCRRGRRCLNGESPATEPVLPAASVAVTVNVY